MNEAIRIGDMVEVRRMRLIGGVWLQDVWLRATVIEIGDTAIGVEFVPSPDHLLSREWLDCRRENQDWRCLT